MSIGLDRNRPGARYFCPSGDSARAALNRSIGFQPIFAEHEDRQHDRRRHQQHGLDDLHPGRGEHAAGDDVDEHERAGEDHAQREVDAHERLDQHARADHLRDQVEGDDAQRAERRRRARRPLVQTEREHVGDRELPGVAHPLGEQEEHGEEGHQEADGVQEAVEAEQEDQSRDPEERRRRHVVAGDREAVLRPGDPAPGGPEVGGRRDPLRREVGDDQRDADDHAEDREGELVDVCCDERHRRVTSSSPLSRAGRSALEASRWLGSRPASTRPRRGRSGQRVEHLVRLAQVPASRGPRP